MQLGEKKLIVQRASVGAKTNMNNVSSRVFDSFLQYRFNFKYDYRTLLLRGSLCNYRGWSGL